jgi:hypothetical protein
VTRRPEYLVNAVCLIVFYVVGLLLLAAWLEVLG